MGGGHLIRLEPGWWWTLMVGVSLARGNNGSLSQRVHYILGTFSNRNHVSDPFYLLWGRIVSENQMHEPLQATFNSMPFSALIR